MDLLSRHRSTLKISYYLGNLKARKYLFLDGVHFIIYLKYIYLFFFFNIVEKNYFFYVSIINCFSSFLIFHIYVRIGNDAANYLS